jgi:hypothetical protein
VPDHLLLLIVGLFSTVSLSVGILALYFAVKAARKNDSEIAMALWSVLALAGFSFAGMAWAYVLIPLLIHMLF